MSRRVNWARAAQRSRMRRYGAEGVSGSTPLQQLFLDLSPPPRRRHTPTKAEMRVLGEAALRAWQARPR